MYHNEWTEFVVHGPPEGSSVAVCTEGTGLVGIVGLGMYSMPLRIMGAPVLVLMVLLGCVSGTGADCIVPGCVVATCADSRVLAMFDWVVTAGGPSG